MTITAPYCAPPRSIHSRLLDPYTGEPVWPLRIIENRITSARSHTPCDAGSPDTNGAASGRAAPEGIMADRPTFHVERANIDTIGPNPNGRAA